MSEVFIKKREKEPIPFDLLLLADPSLEMIDRYINDAEIFLAKSESEIIGVLVLTIAGKAAEIMNISVDTVSQRKGIGSLLIQHSISEAKPMGLEKIYIGTADTSFDQLALYQKLGFKPIDRLVNFFVDNYRESIIENGKQAKDMIRLEMSLT